MSDAPEKLLTFEIKCDGHAAFIKCQGRLVAGTTEEFYQEVKHILPQMKVITIDLEELTYVDSMGLSVLVRLYTSTRQTGCELKLLHLGKQLRNLLTMTNLLSVLCQAEDHGISVA
jgi:anti-sigma B factor antagonist